MIKAAVSHQTPMRWASLKSRVGLLSQQRWSSLLTDDLGDSATQLRARVPALVQALTDEGVLMEIDVWLSVYGTASVARSDSCQIHHFRQT